MAVRKVVSPYAANVRAMERSEQKAAERRYREEDERQYKWEQFRLKEGELRRKRIQDYEDRQAAEKAAQFKEDLIMSIAREEPVGIFKGKTPRIGKVIVHEGTEGTPYRPGVPYGAPGGMVIDPEHLKKLRMLEDTKRRADALGLITKGIKPPEPKGPPFQADLATDYYPIYHGEPKTEAAASAGPAPQMPGIPGQGMGVGQMMGGGMGPGAQMPLGPGDIDLTAWAQKKYAEEPTPDVPMQHLYKVLDMMQNQKKGQFQEKFENFMKQNPSRDEIMRFFGAAEKGTTTKTKELDEATQAIIDKAKAKGGRSAELATDLESRLTGKAPTPAPTKAEAKAKPKAKSPDLATVRRQFNAKMAPVKVEKIEADAEGNITIHGSDGELYSIGPAKK
jgi:hypothetical protein